ncbi:hypothetical protein [Acinetobacter bereziniae]|nr:hypothetical protein [Acinetobacter bereziniae]
MKGCGFCLQTEAKLFRKKHSFQKQFQLKYSAVNSTVLG